MDRTRAPLKETSANVPSPVHKKQKVHRTQVKSININKPDLRLEDEAHREKTRSPTEAAAEDQENLVPHVRDARDIREKEHKETKEKDTRGKLVGDELLAWQTSWRKIMRESVVYFDTQGGDNSAVQVAEQKRAQRALKLVGCTIVPFYDHDVTIIVSRRPFVATKSYAGNDIFRDAVELKIKVWGYDKVFRFLRYLGTSLEPRPELSRQHLNLANLSHLLREEKIFGATERDPNARRDDLHYLEGPHLYVYDLAQTVRPIAVREWGESPYPEFSLTLDGKCPFIADSGDNLDKKRLRRLQKFEATKEYRQRLRQVSQDIVRGQMTDTTLSEAAEDDLLSLSAAAGGSGDFQPPALTRHSSVQPTKFFEVAALGYYGASNAHDSASASNSVSGNGLGPTVSGVPSRNVNNLKRRIFMKRRQRQSDDKEKDLKPGYCENCRVKYDCFDDHISSSRHRNFASDDANFADIDGLIATLHDCKQFGYVTSNGDFRLA